MSKWKIDTAHSEISFKVKHLVISTVTGYFHNFDAEIETNKEDFSDAIIKFEAEVKSINTKNEQRDAHLKSPDFFDAANFPKISFFSDSIEKISGHELKAEGDLTIRGVTKRVKLSVLYNGSVAGLGGNEIAAFEVRTKINRFDFGLKWNSLTEAGGVMVSEEVRIEILAEFAKVAEVVQAA